jgi:UDP-N-acetylglucosamine--N-acetylmuramyl-(pentapeptide) pyrophosphoryl-undecaprenol N-acetylglucosamine transferase
MTPNPRHRIILTGGGTGGHVYPALAIAEQLKKDPEIEDLLYVGAADQIEERLAHENNLEFIGLKITGIPRKLCPELLLWPFTFLQAVRAALEVMDKFAPTVVIGTGGYASAPILAAAYLRHIPYVVHEPDAHPGLVSRVFAGCAQFCSLGMEGAFGRLKPKNKQIEVMGNPVSTKFENRLARDAACAVLGLDPTLKTILVMGGSQGARALNDVLIRALPSLLELDDPPIQIIHQAGEKNIDDVRAALSVLDASNRRYHLRPYFDDMSLAYAVSDLAVCRAGAMTIAELTEVGLPALFIPYPYAAGDHQRHNALFLKVKGAAEMITENRLSVQRLRDHILKLLSDNERLRNMSKAMKSLGHPDAAEKIAARVKRLSLQYLTKNAEMPAAVPNSTI